MPVRKTFQVKTRKHAKGKDKGKGHQLFNNNPPGHSPTTPGTGYGSAEKARKTLKLIKKKPLTYQKQVATTMMYRAKYHKYQTKGMKNAMGIYKKFLSSVKKE